MGAAVPILTRVIEEKLAVTVDHYGGQIKDLSKTVFHPVVILFFFQISFVSVSERCAFLENVFTSFILPLPIHDIYLYFWLTRA